MLRNSYVAVCVEDLELRDIAQALSFGKVVSDNGFGMFRTFLRYKLEAQGNLYIVVDQWFPSTKTCRHCRSVNPDVVLGQSQWVCLNCRAVIERDMNAATNIRNEGLRIFFEERKTA